MFHFKPPQSGKLLNSKMIIIAVAVIVAVSALGTSVYIVNPAEEAVITRFGKYLHTKGPGLQARLPFGIDKNYTVNVREVLEQEFGFRTVRGGAGAIQTRHGEESTMLTGDLNIIDIGWTIQYHVSDARAWIFNVDDRIATIRDVSRTVINQLVGDRAIMGIMGGERIAIQAESLIMMNDIFRQYALGINVTNVLLKNTTPPAGVQAAFEDVNMALQDRERLINEGRQAYNEVIPRTRGEVERMILSARGFAAERVNRALGDVARFNAVLAEYQLAPEVTRQRLYFEVMEEVFSTMEGTTLIDHKLNNVLPLMNIGGNR
ncbi:MAG: FtsH protease activity modulator HflK [Treponema sp.]|nr:FtsH protease activity modulator HflK [Treponema sp.]